MFRAPRPLTVRWRPVEGDGLEHLTLTPSDEGIVADSFVIGDRGGGPYGLHYRIDLDPRWRVRSFRIETGDGRGLALWSDGEGRWRTPDGAARPEFDGCIDIDLAGTPFTNTLPIRRMAQTPQMGAIELTMLYVPFDTFEAVTDGQIYTCLEAGKRYLYQAADRTFEAELPVDEDGLVMDYPTLFTRLTKTAP